MAPVIPGPSARHIDHLVPQRRKQISKINRRTFVRGAAAAPAAFGGFNILTARAAEPEFKWKFGSLHPADTPMVNRVMEIGPKILCRAKEASLALSSVCDRQIIEIERVRANAKAKPIYCDAGTLVTATQAISAGPISLTCVGATVCAMQR
jgi:hypothetical protein